MKSSISYMDAGLGCLASRLSFRPTVYGQAPTGTERSKLRHYKEVRTVAIFAFAVVTAFFCATAHPQGAPAQSPNPGQISVKVNLVTVSFVARDERGALVPNLTADDLDVFEDSAPQTIAHFAKSADVPLTLGVIVDASGSQDHFEKQHKNDLEVFFKDVLGPKDRVFLVGFGNHIRLVSDFSSSGDGLLDDWKAYQKGKRRFATLGPDEDRDLGTAFYDSIFYSTTEKLAKENGRRAILLFSDGEDNSSSHDMMTAIETAQEENVVVYAIRYTEKEHGKLTARNKYGISVMDRVSRETGGAHIDAETTDPHTYFRQIAEELRTSYELAYYPKDLLKDDSFRKIRIKAKRDGITVRAKTGYFAR